MKDAQSRWRVGDRLWTPHDGTCTVRRLRDRGDGSAIDALVESHWLRQGDGHWCRLTEHCVRLEPGEPDRPSIGVQTVTVGQWVWHAKWGIGCVLRVEEVDGYNAAHIEFYDLGLERDAHPQRTVALGGGFLLDAQEALRGDER